MSPQIRQPSEASEAIGSAYFEALVERLARALDAEYALVGRLSTDHSHIDIIAAHVAPGADGLPDSYPLSDSPCADAITQGTLLLVSGAQASYPEHAALRQFGIDGYGATALHRRDGRVFGILAVMTRHAFQQPELVRALLEAHAERTAAEIERADADARLRRSDETLRRHQAALWRIVHEELLFGADSLQALRRIAQIVLASLEADHASIWQASADYQRLDCLVSVPEAAPTPLPQMRAAQHAEFFEALRARGVLDCGLANELSLSCSTPHHASAAAPAEPNPCGHTIVLRVSNGPQMLGMLCVRYCRAEYAWNLEEAGFARSVSHLLALAFVSEAARASERRYRELYASMEQQIEQRLRDAQRQQDELIEQQRQFVYLASHELRTPLAIIDSAAQRLLRRADTLHPDELRERLGKIRAAVTRMLNLVDSTLDTARFESGNVDFRPQPMSLYKLLHTICLQHQELSPLHHIILETAHLPQTIDADPALLQQVFANLVSNAIKYAPNGGEIRISAQVDSNDATVTIRVCDQGLGIPRDELPRLFNRFFRASTAAGIAGTGIGLALTRQIVELHGGHIEVDSDIGLGTTVSVTLPLRTVAATPG